MVHMTKEKMEQLIVPLPPLAEQHRIVAKVDELMALCDRLEAAREGCRDWLTAASLVRLDRPDPDAAAFRGYAVRALETFPSLTERPDQIKALRRTIPNLAVRGKLVEQDPEDEPASVLLERASKRRTELLKAGYPNASEARTQLKKLSQQKLPRTLQPLLFGWSWATLQQCSLLVVDCKNKTAPYSQTGIKLIRTTNVRNGELNSNDQKYVNDETYAIWSGRCIPEAGDILITREAPMGEVCLVPFGEKICLGQRMMLARLVPETIDSGFTLYSLRDPNLMDRVQDKPLGMTVQHLRVGGVETLLVPLPPLAEQRRIVGDFVKLRRPTDRAPDDDYEIEVEPLDDEAEAPRAASRAVLLHVPGARRVGREDCVVRDGTGDAASDDLPLSISSIVEPACCGGGGTAPKPPRPMRFGAPFLLGNAMPLLLEAAVPTVAQGDGPSRGRRLLSFTDSRQGTARFAAKLQQEAERNLTRATIYHAVQAGGRGGDADEIKALENEIAMFRRHGLPEDFIQTKVNALAKISASSGQQVAWPDLVDAFAKNSELADFATATWDHHLRSDRAFADPTKLAELFLYRETFRRPRVQNNVETMGLAALAFPKLDGLTLNTVPGPMREAGLGADDWRNFLYLCVDIGLRQQLKVDATPTVARWASPSRHCGTVLPPRSSKPKSKSKHVWPLASTSANNRLIRILAHVLKADLNDPGDRDRADECMDDAWKALRQSGAIKETSPDEWALDCKTAAFVPVGRAWQCPITRRVLARTVRGLTPYGFTRHHDAAAEAMPVAMPRLPDASPVGLTPPRREAVAAWIEADPHIKELRARGVWSDLHDRVATFQPFLRAVEHSAQLDRQTLEGYEAGFKAGRINILNCSTTMEMGVDIANIGVVVNTNVPPAPANYRQRIGRAGRRGEPRALAFTFCKDAPLDRAVFREPQRLLGGAMLAPRVALDSAVIVQRHVNAFLLGHFLREKAHDWLFNMRIGEFFGVPDTLDGPRPSDVSSVFEDFLRAPGGLASPLPERLATIVRGSSLSNAPNLPARCADRLFEVRAAWMKERKAIEEAAQGFDSAGAAYKALDHRFRRLSREYLLGELARRGFLPSYGFPVDVVAFDAKARTKDDGFRRRESLFKAGPSRTLDIAIRDYAPGSDIVVDGLVYRSAGITPSWSLPTTTGSSTEDIRTAWRCGACDTFGVDNVPPPACDVCAAPVPHSFDCLRPAGFGGDQEPHASYESVAYVAPSEPWVTAKAGAWQAAPQSLRGRFRATHEGQVLVFSRGAENEGYALCLGCGRAEAEAAEGDGQRKPLKGHKPLYPAKHLLAQDGTCRAGSSSHGIKRNLALGYTFTTDVFEMQLVDPRGEDAAGIAFALGCALREALARRIGVEAEEMGVTTHRPDKGDGASHTGVLLHDKASGGAGFSPLAAPMLPGLLADAARILACPAECASGCSECIVRADVQYQAHQIDRRKAFTWLQGVLLNS